MSDDLRLQKLLEEATAPGSEMPAGLDAETSSLREAWLAVGRTLAAAEAAAGPPREFSKLVAPTARRSWSKNAIVALAASLLILASALTVRGFRSNLARQQPDGSGAQAESTDPTLVGSEQATKPIEGWEWDEAIDSEIGNARLGMVWFGQDSRPLSDSFPLTGQEILEIQADINDSTF